MTLFFPQTLAPEILSSPPRDFFFPFSELLNSQILSLCREHHIFYAEAENQHATFAIFDPGGKCYCCIVSKCFEIHTFLQNNPPLRSPFRLFSTDVTRCHRSLFCSHILQLNISSAFREPFISPHFTPPNQR